jgi:hypothetical protein
VTILRWTLAYFIVQTILISVGFILRLDWIFPLLALVNLVAGPAALGFYLLDRWSGSRSPSGR